MCGLSGCVLCAGVCTYVRLRGAAAGTILRAWEAVGHSFTDAGPPGWASRTRTRTRHATAGSHAAGLSLYPTFGDALQVVDEVLHDDVQIRAPVSMKRCNAQLYNRRNTQIHHRTRPNVVGLKCKITLFAYLSP